ncbi:MAG TPA: TIGR02391 family protein, partial [Pseudonocardiaceae bacterium]|nr:TIGR02391 family protein [Pseudonocardiaceae bacterium]
MRQQLEEFHSLATHYRMTVRGYTGDDQLRQRLFRAEPTIRKILTTLDPKLAEALNLDQVAGEAMARTLVQQALGILDDMDKWAANLAPDAPTMPADQFHQWVWDAARTFWESKHYRAAVDAAARSINVHTHDK